MRKAGETGDLSVKFAEQLAQLQQLGLVRAPFLSATTTTTAITTTSTAASTTAAMHIREYWTEGAFVVRAQPADKTDNDLLEMLNLADGDVQNAYQLLQS